MDGDKVSFVNFLTVNNLGKLLLRAQGIGNADKGRKNDWDLMMMSMA